MHDFLHGVLVLVETFLGTLGQFGQSLVEVGDLLDGLLQIEAHLDVVIFAQLVKHGDGLELLRELLVLFLYIFQSVNLLHVDIKTAGELVQDLRGLGQFFSQGLGLGLHCIGHIALYRIYHLLWKVCKVLFKAKGLDKDGAHLSVGVRHFFNHGGKLLHLHPCFLVETHLSRDLFVSLVKLPVVCKVIDLLQDIKLLHVLPAFLDVLCNHIKY